MRRCRARRRWHDDPTLICGHEVADVVVGEIVDGHPVVPHSQQSADVTRAGR
jgi:hypothetical protein